MFHPPIRFNFEKNHAARVSGIVMLIISPFYKYSIIFRMEASSPSYGSEGETRNHRDAAEHISSIEKENFNLKLRIYHMEEHLNSNGGQDFQSILQQKVEVNIPSISSRFLAFL